MFYAVMVPMASGWTQVGRRYATRAGATRHLNELIERDADLYRGARVMEIR